MSTPDPAFVCVAAIVTSAAAFIYFYGGLFRGRVKLAGVIVAAASIAAAVWLM